MSNQINQTEVTEREIPCLHVMQGHQAGVYGALLLRDGRLLSYSPDEPFLLWDPLTGKCIDQISAFEPSIAGMLQIDDEQILLWPELPEAASALAEGAPSSEPCKPRYPSPFEPSHIVLWNLRTHRRTPLQCECVSPLAHVELAGDGWLRAWSHDGVLFAWKMSDPDTVFRTAPMVSQLTELIFLADGRSMLRTLAHELRINAKEQEGFDLLLKGHKAGIRFASELSDGRILSCSEDATLRLFNSHTGLCEHVLKGHQDVVIAACELPDGQLLSWSADETFRVWNTASGRCIKVIHDKRAAQAWRGIRLGCWKILLWSQMTESWIFNPVTLEIESVLAGHEATIRGFVQLKNGNVVSFSDDRTLRLWQTGVIGERGKSKEERDNTPTDQHLQMMLDELGRGDESETGTREEGEVNMGTLLSYEQRCKNFSRPKRTSGHDRQQQHERSRVMSEDKREAYVEEAKQKLMDFIAGEGFRPELDKDGDIHFKCEGKHLFLILRKEDTQFLRLLHPGFWEIENDEERQKALEAAQYASARCKVCKVTLRDDNTNVDAAIELFAADPAHVIAIFTRAVHALQTGISCFVAKMRGEEE